MDGWPGRPGRILNLEFQSRSLAGFPRNQSDYNFVDPSICIMLIDSAKLELGFHLQVCKLNHFFFYLIR